MSEIKSILDELGPSRASTVANILQERFSLSPDAARQRIARARGDYVRFPISLLPNRESFIYLENQRTEEWFWMNLHAALRETGAIYGFALDGIIARKGIVRKSEFPVISGAPLAMKKQVSAERVLNTLVIAGALRVEQFSGEECVVLNELQLEDVDRNGFKARSVVEDALLDAVRDWSRKMGLASYNKIGIRVNDMTKRTIGSFVCDLAGPSYILPLKGQGNNPGWLTADVFSGATLDENHIGYFIRKAQLLKATQKKVGCLSLLIADGFTGPALTKGHSAGIVLATPETLFGRGVAMALKNLLDTLNNAAAIASANPDRLVKLIGQLGEIEGAVGNLRGVLFELISAHIAKVQGGSIDFAVNAKDPESGKTYDIDVLRVISKGECVAIECKGKNPGGSVSIAEVENWLQRLAPFKRYLKNEPRFKDAIISFELWTSGTFQEDALKKLGEEKKNRKSAPISWKTGDQVFAISNKAKEKKINDVLKEHFLRHPLSK